MGWDDGTGGARGPRRRGRSKCGITSDRPTPNQISLSTHRQQVGRWRERGDRDNLACCPTRGRRADGGDGLFVRALWLNYDALLRIPATQPTATLDGWHSFWKWLPAFPPRDFEQCSGTWSEELFHSFPTMQGDFAPRRKISSFFKRRTSAA